MPDLEGLVFLPVGLACGASAAALWRLVVPRLPEPADPDPRKPRYADLETRANSLVVTAVATTAGMGAWSAPHAARGALVVLATGGSVLVAIDAMTTYLPRRETWWCAILALAASALLAPPLLLLHGLLGALGALLVFWLFWRLTGALGFGDMRLALPLGLAAGLLGLRGWVAWLACGTAAGALWGVATTAWRRHHPSSWGSVFPYGPGLWLGLWPAVLWAGH